jgi:uncharacterized membrane protein YkoI
MRRTTPNTIAHAISRQSLLSAGLLASLAFTTTAAAQNALTEAQVKSMLEAQGYTRIDDVEFKDGMWKTDARSADGNRVDLRVDAATGKVYPETQVANLNKADVEAKLAAAGYLNVHDLEFRDGIWTAKAENEDGKDFELRIDAATGDIIGKRRD